MIDKNTEPIKGVQGKMREKKFPGPQLIELSWDVKFSRWVQRIWDGFKRGIHASDVYEPTWKKILKRIALFIESLVNLIGGQNWLSKLFKK